jgi:hypothetical protein
MKFLKSAPVIAASIGRMIVLSIPRRPEASPAKNAEAASAHPTPVNLAPFADPLCAETLAHIAAQRKWVVAVCLISVFIVLPALVIVLVGVL